MMIFYDIETTGFNRSSDQIIQIAAAVLNDELEVIDTFDSFIKPDKNIPYQITQLTGITDDMVSDAMPEGVVILNFQNFIAKHDPLYICGHNISAFDNGFVAAKCLKYSIVNHISDKTIIDTLKMVKELVKQKKLSTYNRITAAGNPSYTLTNLMAYYDMGTQNHQALDDVMNNIQIYKNLLNEKEDYDYGF